MERISQDQIPAGLFDCLLRVNAFIDSGGLDFGLLELCRLRISQMNGCAYCIDLHLRESERAGIPLSRVAMLAAWREAPGFGQRERAALAFAEAFTRLPDGPLDERVHAALSECYTPREQAILALAVGQMNLWNRLMRAFGTPPPSAA